MSIEKPAKRPRGRPKGSRATRLRNVPEALQRRLVVAQVTLEQMLVEVLAAAEKAGVWDSERFADEHIQRLRREIVERWGLTSSERPGRTRALELAARHLGVGTEYVRAVYYAKNRLKGR